MTFDRRASTATQLSLPLDGAPSPLTDAPGGALPGAAPGLPAIDIAPEWKDQQRLWGHALHPMCSYLASFPAALAHAFIAPLLAAAATSSSTRSAAAARRRSRPAPRAGSASATTSTRSPTC